MVAQYDGPRRVPGMAECRRVGRAASFSAACVAHHPLQRAAKHMRWHVLNYGGMVGDKLAKARFYPPYNSFGLERRP